MLFDRLLGELRHWHPLVGFGRWAGWVESRCYQPSVLRGAMALGLAVLPFVLVAGIADGYLVGIILLYFSLGARSLFEHADAVSRALQHDDLAEARQAVGLMVSRNTADMTPADVSRAAIESVLENGNDAVFAAIFWFAVLGSPAVVMYRLVNTLDAMWGYRNERYDCFGRAAARLDDVLNYIPARLTAAAYAVCGNFPVAVKSWRGQGHTWDSPNAGPVMASGAGALSLRLGGPAIYHGRRRDRPTLGSGLSPQADDIERATALVKRAMLLWMFVLVLIETGRSLA